MWEEEKSLFPLSVAIVVVDVCGLCYKSHVLLHILKLSVETSLFTALYILKLNTTNQKVSYSATCDTRCHMYTTCMFLFICTIRVNICQWECAASIRYWNQNNLTGHVGLLFQLAAWLGRTFISLAVATITCGCAKEHTGISGWSEFNLTTFLKLKLGESVSWLLHEDLLWLPHVGRAWPCSVALDWSSVPSQFCHFVNKV